MTRTSTTATPLALVLMAAFLVACIPEQEPNDTNGDASDNNYFDYNKNTTQGANFVLEGAVNKNNDDKDIWFHYTTEASNDLTVAIQSAKDLAGNDACVIADVKKCTAQVPWWSDCPSNQRQDVGLIWNCDVFGSANPEVDLTIGLNKLIRVEVNYWPGGPTDVEYSYSMFPN